MGCYICMYRCRTVLSQADALYYSPRSDQAKYIYMLDVCDQHNYIIMQAITMLNLIMREVNSVYVAISCNNVDFNGVMISCVQSDLHLGDLIGNYIKEQSAKKFTDDFLKRFKVLFSKFNICHYETKYKLFQTYCMSLYVLRDVQYPNIQAFFLLPSVNKLDVYLRLFNIPYRTHCSS